MPSGLVITRLPVPELETATNTPLPYTTERQALLAADDLDVHVTPSGLVITRLLLPLMPMPTATNRPFPYVTARQSFTDAGVLDVQLMPSGLVITTLPA